MAQPTIPYLLPQQTLGGTLCTLYGIILCHIIKISSTLQTYLPSEFRNSHGEKSTQNKHYIIKMLPPIYSSTSFTSTDKCLAIKSNSFLN